MTKFDQFIHSELESQLQAGEKIILTGVLFNKSLAVAALVSPLTLYGSGYFLAAVTPLRLVLIKTRMGFFSLKMANDGVIEIPYANVKSIEKGGGLNQKTIAISFKDGSALKYRLNTFDKKTTGQKEFIATLCRLHANATNGA